MVRPTARKAIFLCLRNIVCVWGSLLFLLLTGDSLYCITAQFVPCRCLWAIHLQYLLFPQRVIAHNLSPTSLRGLMWPLQSAFWLLADNTYFSLIKAQKKLCQITMGVYFVVDIIKYLTAKALNAIAELTCRLENDSVRLWLIGAWSATA